MSSSLSSSDDDEKLIDKNFLKDIDEKIALSGGRKTVEPLVRGAGQVQKVIPRHNVLVEDFPAFLIFFWL